MIGPDESHSVYEVELKVPADHTQIRQALTERGSTLEGPIGQSDTYYNAPHRDFAETDEALRLRRTEPVTDPSGDVAETVSAAVSDGTATLTYKGPLLESEAKSREEVEVQVGNSEQTGMLLTNLGFEAAASVAKLRETAQINGYEVTLDRVAGLGSYVEVEGEAPDESDIRAVTAGARSVLRDLGLDPTDSIQSSYLELLQEGPDNN